MNDTISVVKKSLQKERGKLIMISPEQLDKDILNMNYDDLVDMTNNSTDQNEAKFWLTIRERALQLRQKEIINSKKFIR